MYCIESCLTNMFLLLTILSVKVPKSKAVGSPVLAVLTAAVFYCGIELGSSSLEMCEKVKQGINAQGVCMLSKT